MLSEEEPELQELFANLLSASMDKETSSFVHPSFVEAIKQMTPDEAKLMRFFSKEASLPIISIRNDKKDSSGGRSHLRYLSVLGEKADCQNPALTPVLIDNLIRLGFIEIPIIGFSYTDKSLYDEIKNHPQVLKVMEELNNIPDRKGTIIEQSIQVTDIGRLFIKVCVLDHRQLRH